MIVELEENLVFNIYILKNHVITISLVTNTYSFADACFIL